MNNYQTSKKYDSLFSSGRELAHRTGLCVRGEVEGATIEEISEFEKEYDLIFPPVMVSYLRHFGRKARAWMTDYDCAYTLSSISYAISQANVREEWHEMKNVKELLKTRAYKVNYDEIPEDEDENQNLPLLTDLVNVDNIIILHYDTFSRTYYFIDGDSENGYIYSYCNYTTVTSIYLSYTNWYRYTLALLIRTVANEDMPELAVINGNLIPVEPLLDIDYSNGFEYLKKAITISRHIKKEKQVTTLNKIRNEFFVINDEIERMENRILPFNEFEDNFIKHLENKGLYRFN